MTSSDRQAINELLDQLPDGALPLVHRFLRNITHTRAVVSACVTLPTVQGKRKMLGATSAPPVFLEKSMLVNFEGADSFISLDGFVLGENGGAKISRVCVGFEKRLLGKSEEGVIPSELSVRRLARPVKPQSIIEAVGGMKSIEITLAEFHTVLSKEIPCLTTGHAVVGVVRDVDGVLCWVYACWSGNRGWRVNAFPIDDHDGWGPNDHVVVRNSPQMRFPFISDLVL